MKTAATMAGMLSLAVVVSGCQTVRDARARLVREPKACRDMTIPVYFEPNVAQLTVEGRRVISAAARQARPCRVEAVRVLGLADAAGPADANLDLSRRRADAVAQAILAAGLPAATFEVDAAGQAGAVAADGSVAPVRRRADITLKLGDPS